MKQNSSKPGCSPDPELSGTRNQAVSVNLFASTIVHKDLAGDEARDGEGEEILSHKWSSHQNGLLGHNSCGISPLHNNPPFL